MGSAPAFFSQPAGTSPVIQAKCAACEAQDQKQEKAPGDFIALKQDASASIDTPVTEEETEEGLQAKLTVGEAGDRYEREADTVADRVVQRAGGEADNASTVGPGEKPEAEIQAKLTIGEPGDQYEREADAVADQVVQRAAADTISVGNTPAIQAECDECKIDPPNEEELAEDETEEVISPKRIAAAGDEQPDDNGLNTLHAGLRSSQGQGKPLPADTLQMMQDSFGEDFTHVRIHTDNNSAHMNRSIRARAFTHNNQIYFNSGNFNPQHREGLRLLAHELTHVVQQTGSRAMPSRIQRDSESKIGDWAHDNVQQRLRGMDNKLITEAPIPGGTRDGTEHNSVGFADFYKSEDNIISGIRAIEPAESKDLEEAHKTFKYQNMPVPSAASARLPGFKKTKWQKVAPRGIIKHGPRIKNHKRNKWDFTPNFPAWFKVGELKPLFPTQFTSSLAYHGTGFLQAGNYRTGFMNFVRDTYVNNPDHQSNLPSSINGEALDIPDGNIPPEINYKHFEAERLKTGPEWIWKKEHGLKERVWIYKLKDGVYVYFLIPHPYVSTEYPEKVDEQLKRLDPMLARLRRKRPGMANTLLTKREQPQSRPIISIRKKAAVPSLQAKKTDWKKLAKEWEDERKDWVKGRAGKPKAGAPPQPKIDKPKEFLKEQAKGVERKDKTDEKLSQKADVKPKVSEKLKEQIKQVNQIRFWSSFRGRILGALRFRFGKVFDKVEDLFENMKKKFKKHHTSSDRLNRKSGIFAGWKKVATRAIIRFSVEILKEMLVHAFKGFVNCMNGIIEAILGRFTSAVDEAKEDLAKEIEPVCCEVMSFKNSLEEKYKEHEKTIAGFTEAVEKIQKWREILDYVETAVRIGVQIISCGTPPGLGCLWGLVAQLGIGAGLSLLSRTDYFEEEIAKPAARQLMDTIVGDSLHNFLIDTLEGMPLIKPFVAEAAECRRRHSDTGGRTIGGNTGKLDPNDPANRKIVEQWEKENMGQILQDLESVFAKDGKKKVSEEDLKKLIEQIKASGKNPDEIKKLLEAIPRDPATGKLNIATAGEVINKGEAPAPVPKERDLDYDKAMRNNAQYEKTIGWEPHTFIKKAGIKADSREFAEAIYDMQEAIGVKADGLAGPKTTVNFYDKNRLPKDRAYQNATQEIQIQEIAKIRAAAYPEKKQLISDLNKIDWSSVPAGGLRIAEIGGNKLLLLRTDNGARVGAYYRDYKITHNGENFLKIVGTSIFTNLDPIKSGDSTGVITHTLTGKKSTRLGHLFIIEEGGEMAVHSDLEMESDFVGLLIEKIP